MKILIMTVLFVVAFGMGGMIAEVTHKPTTQVKTETVTDYESLDACVSAYYTSVDTIDKQIDIINSLIDILWGDESVLNFARKTPKPDHLLKIDGTKPSPATLKI